jgi:hypothetical protein
MERHITPYTLKYISTDLRGIYSSTFVVRSNEARLLRRKSQRPRPHKFTTPRFAPPAECNPPIRGRRNVILGLRNSTAHRAGYRISVIRLAVLYRANHHQVELLCNCFNPRLVASRRLKMCTLPYSSSCRTVRSTSTGDATWLCAPRFSTARGRSGRAPLLPDLERRDTSEVGRTTSGGVDRSGRGAAGKVAICWS